MMRDGPSRDKPELALSYLVYLLSSLHLRALFRRYSDTPGGPASWLRIIALGILLVSCDVIMKNMHSCSHTCPDELITYLMSSLQRVSLFMLNCMQWTPFVPNRPLHEL